MDDGSNVTDLNAKRWEQVTNPDKHKPREALLAALRALDAGEIEPDHIMVVWAGNRETGYFQAGSFGYHSRLGMLFKAQCVAERG